VSSCLKGKCIYNPTTQEAEAGGSRVGGQPGLHNKTFFGEKKSCEILLTGVK
jgi:hypothetical protein